MNPSTFLRVINKTSKFLINNGPYCRKYRAINVSCMSTNASVSHSEKEKDSFVDVLPSITDAIMKNPKLAQQPEVGSWLKKVLEYNLRGGKKARGLTTVLAYETLEKPENITEESMHLARVMGWCVEMLQAYLLVIDDIMDGSTTRRGQPCWYRLPEVGLGAINDTILLHMSIFHTLKVHIGSKPYYAAVVDLFNDSLMTTSIGQHLDYIMAHRTKNDYSLFTIDRYDAIVTHKTSHYTYLLPVRLGFYLAGKTSPELHSNVEEMCLKIGHYFQIQDDYLDCFGDESVTGKKGTDIQEGKCSWLAVQALQRCSAEQRALFESNYARADERCVQRVKRLYEQLGLPALYREHERAVYDDVARRAHALPQTSAGETVSPALFMILLDMIYKRKQ